MLVVSVILYFYTAWIVRLDLRFLSSHPRKIRFTIYLTFYLPIIGSALLLMLAPFALTQPWLLEPDARCFYFLAVPALLSSSAGAYKSISAMGLD